MSFPVQAEGPDPVDTFVGRRLRDLRKRRKFSQTDIGRRAGVTFQQIQKYESGANRISVSMLFRLASALEVSVAEFFVGLPEPGSPATAAVTMDVAGSMGVVEAVLRMPPDVRVRFLALARSLVSELQGAASSGG